MKSRIARAALALAALLVGSPGIAAPPKPKLIVAIAVDQFSADLFAEHRANFTGGLKRLADGVIFPSGYQSHAATETCPGHATILTGARPARSGIIANSWYDLGLDRADKKVYCAEDPGAPGSSSEHYVVSPRLLKVPTLGDRLKAADPRSRVVSVAGKDRAAVMLGGHAADQIWYWGGKGFVTLSDRPAPPPAIVRQVNALIAPRTSDPKAFRVSPEFDAATADVAIGVLRTMKLGHGAATDLLAIGLSATDYVGHRFGTEGPEMKAQIAALDQAIGRIFAALDANGAPYVIALTADHGGHDTPERNQLRGILEAARVDPALLPENFGAALAADLKFDPARSPIYADGPFGDWYFARTSAANLRDIARNRLLAHPQVVAAFTAEELRALPQPSGPPDEWTLAERARASFDPSRSGDLIVLLKPRITPISDGAKGTVATHGSPWDYDRRVPILFWWPGVSGFEQPLSVETVDILPTLAGLIRLTVPKGEIDGRCLDLDPSENSTC